MTDINKLLRPHLLNRKPYASARDEFTEPAEIYLDANENPFPSATNRYPDPRQVKLKAVVARLKEVQPEQVFIGNGSDEVLDLLFRAFCEPGQDNVIITPPTYGMYEVLAQINNILLKEAPLNTDYSLNAELLLSQVEGNTKLIFLCNPNNPTGNLLDTTAVEQVLQSFNGLVVIDEAYIDFANNPGFLPQLQSYDNLVVVQTLSKAWGLAGLRLGLGFASPEIVQILDNIKPPYNINSNSQQEALKRLADPSKAKAQVQLIVLEREDMRKALESLPGVHRVYPSETNFLLVQIENATKIYHSLLQQGIVLRNRSGILHCNECLRITIGTPEENARVLKALIEFIFNAKEINA
ncbi:MAG: histidinol-phosphate transaminase [Bacteroidales bacterium]|nr:histidinol-phosphate transaminase [Bacteroidales bacterium]